MEGEQSFRNERTGPSAAGGSYPRDVILGSQTRFPSCLQALTPPASFCWVSRPWDAMSQAGQLGGGAALGWESWGPRFL